MATEQEQFDFLSIRGNWLRASTPPVPMTKAENPGLARIYGLNSSGICYFINTTSTGFAVITVHHVFEIMQSLFYQGESWKAVQSFTHLVREPGDNQPDGTTIFSVEGKLRGVQKLVCHIRRDVTTIPKEVVTWSMLDQCWLPFSTVCPSETGFKVVGRKMKRPDGNISEAYIKSGMSGSPALESKNGVPIQDKEGYFISRGEFAYVPTALAFHDGPNARSVFGGIYNGKIPITDSLNKHD